MNMNNLPEVYVKQSSIVNAYTVSRTSNNNNDNNNNNNKNNKSVIVLHSALIELLSEDELLCVLSHELSHIKCAHAMYFR